MTDSSALKRTPFHAIHVAANELRQDLARRYLDGGQVSVSKVAWLLGYQGVGPFSHAFKRWSGKSPRTYRRDSLK